MPTNSSPTATNRPRGEWLVLAAAVLWGTTGTAQALAPAGVSPLAIGAIRICIGGMSLLVLAGWRKQLFRSGRWPLTPLVLSAFFVAMYQVCFFAGVARTGVAVGTMVAIGSSPIAAGLLGFIFRKERLGKRWSLATLLAIIGCSLLIFSGQGLTVKPTGFVLALGAGFSYAAYAVSVKGLLEHHAPDAIMALVFTLAAVLLVPFLFTTNLTWLLSPRGLAVALHLGIVATALSYLLFAAGLQSTKVGTAATLSLAEPLTATLLGLLVLQERLGPNGLLGVCILFSGIALLAVPAGRPQQ